LTATNKLQKLTEQTILSDADVNYVNNLGWAAGWMLCTFNALYFLFMLLDYIFDLIDYLKIKK
jgi:hypothetical protein